MMSKQQMLSKLRVCVVGTGPAGLYTAKYLKQSLHQTKRHLFDSLNITLLDRLPTPYGLVRYGVAPDHPEVKNVQNEFHQMLEDDRETFSFVGNMQLGQNVTLNQLRELYHIVVLAYGAAHSDNLLNVPGEKELSGVISARDVVNWYNVLPDPHFDHGQMHARMSQLLNTSDRISIVGQGNVALDVARILATRPDQLIQPEFDIMHEAYQLLQTVYERSKLISLIGRRGPAQAACTTKELRELLNLNKDHPTLYLSQENMRLVESGLQKKNILRPTKRLLDVFKQATILSNEATIERPQVEFSFLRRPVALLPSQKDRSRVGSMKCEIMELTEMEGMDNFANAGVRGTGEYDEVKTDLVIRSIGYRSDMSIPDVPYDKHGRVINDRGKVSNNLYVSGWLKRGATGIINTNIIDAKETVETIVSDMSDNELHMMEKGEKRGDSGLIEIAEEKHTPIVLFSDWLNIEREEERRGAQIGLKRSKLKTIDEMIKHARKTE